jgi:hypothetical protein
MSAIGVSNIAESAISVDADDDDDEGDGEEYADIGIETTQSKKRGYITLGNHFFAYLKRPLESLTSEEVSGELLGKFASFMMTGRPSCKTWNTAIKNISFLKNYLEENFEQQCNTKAFENHYAKIRNNVEKFYIEKASKPNPITGKKRPIVESTDVGRYSDFEYNMKSAFVLQKLDTLYLHNIAWQTLARSVEQNDLSWDCFSLYNEEMPLPQRRTRAYFQVDWFRIKTGMSSMITLCPYPGPKPWLCPLWCIGSMIANDIVHPGTVVYNDGASNISKQMSTDFKVFKFIVLY